MPTSTQTLIVQRTSEDRTKLTQHYLKRFTGGEGFYRMEVTVNGETTVTETSITEKQFQRCLQIYQEKGIQTDNSLYQ
jgi:hypothetical protein